MDDEDEVEGYLAYDWTTGHMVADVFELAAAQAEMFAQFMRDQAARAAAQSNLNVDREKWRREAALDIENMTGGPDGAGRTTQAE